MSHHVSIAIASHHTAKLAWHHLINLLHIDAGLAWEPVGRSCIKRISLGAAPKALCLHLRRAFWTDTGRQVKLSGHIPFPMTLDLSPYSAANMLPLCRLGQQFVPSASQTHWMGLNHTEAGAHDPTALPSSSVGAHHGSLRSADLAGSAAQTAASSVAGRVNSAAAEAARALRTADAASACPVDSYPAHASPAAQRAAESDAAAAEPQARSRQGPKPASPFGMHHPEAESQKAGAAGADAGDSGSQQAGSSSGAHPAGDSLRAARQDADDLQGNGSRAGPPAGPVQRLLASHPLSPASSLMSEGSLPDNQGFADTSAPATSSQDFAAAPAASSSAAAAAGDKLHRPAGGSQADQAATNPVQKAPQSHPLSFASSLVSDSSLLPSSSLDTASLEQSEGASGPVTVSQGRDPASRIGRTSRFACTGTSDTAVRGAAGGSAARSMEEDAETDGAAAACCSEDCLAAHDGSAVSQDNAVNLSNDADSSTSQMSGAMGGFHNLACDDKRQHYRMSQGKAVEQVSNSSPALSSCRTEPFQDADALDGAADIQAQLDSSNRQSPVYHLTAAVVHHGGGSGSGHYTAYRRVVLKQTSASEMPERVLWFSSSDETVHQVDMSEVLSCEATMLMYDLERVAVLPLAL